MLSKRSLLHRFSQAASLAFATGPALLLSASVASPASAPNIVLILADDLGFSDTAPYGSEIDTPNISQLAAEGLRFTNYHTAASCAPTRAMLLTGVDSHRNGVPNIPEAIPAEQQEQYPNYAGTLGHNVVTVATLLKDAGYHTYMTGKWHLGHETADLLPSNRGFERTVAMADTGADNWEKKPYLPIYAKANWYGDGKEIDLPEDFYSSKFFIDKTIEFIESNRADGRPFFSYIPFQAVHIPVQAPQEFTDKYLGKYDAGWTALRGSRLERVKELGIVGELTTLAPVASTQDWDALDVEQQRHASKSMAVYAGMVDAMDHHIGRLLDYLRETGEYDNTVFIFTSDNGAEGSDSSAFSFPQFVVDFSLANMGYDTDYETLGLRGSYVTIGPSFASAASSPLAYYKFFSHDGGMRVPLIIAGDVVARPGSGSGAFAYVTDLAPTILEIAGVSPHGGSHAGKSVEPMTGASLLDLAAGRSERVHGPDEAIGYELGGNAALFKGDYKIVKDRGPIGDDRWHLYDIVADPGEAEDLRERMPDRFAAMMADYQAYVARNGVLPVPEGYDQRVETFSKGLKKRYGYRPLIVPIILTLLIVWVIRRRRTSPGSGS